MKTIDFEVGRMDAPARTVSQAEAPIPQNIRKDNASDLPTTPPHHRGGRRAHHWWGEGLRASHHIYIYIYIRLHVYHVNTRRASNDGL